jgi:hypothetical protein
MVLPHVQRQQPTTPSSKPSGEAPSTAISPQTGIPFHPLPHHFFFLSHGHGSSLQWVKIFALPASNSYSISHMPASTPFDKLNDDNYAAWAMYMKALLKLRSAIPVLVKYPLRGQVSSLYTSLCHWDETWTMSENKV